MSCGIFNAGLFYFYKIRWVLNIPLVLDIIGSWVFPGFGFLRRRHYLRGVVLFFLIEGTAFIGLFLHGSVVYPIVNASGGGIISLLTFLIQLGNGAISILCLIAGSFRSIRDEMGGGMGLFLRLFAGHPSEALFDLGSFYHLVSGAMNYFVVTNFYDRYKAKGEAAKL